MDALSFIEKGWDRAVTLHNTSGVPWSALRGNADILIFAFDNDQTGQEDAVERAREAVLRGFEAHVLPGDEEAYGGEGDPNEALQAGTLDLSYLAKLSGATSTEVQRGGRDAPPSSTGNMGDDETDADREDANREQTGNEGTEWPVSERIRARDGDWRPASPDDLVSYWNGEDIGHLGRWLRTTDIPDGPVGEGLYADRSLRRWIASELEKGPGEAEDIERLEWALWRVYAAHGPEDVPERQIPDPPESEDRDTEGSREKDSDLYDLGHLPGPVDTWRTEAPAPCPSCEIGRGIALDTPYDESFIRDLKSTLPRWALEWRDGGGVWVVDDMLASLVGDMLRFHFG